MFADEFLDGLFQSSYLNNGILLVDANGKKITERTIKDREINKNIYQHIEENREERIYETKKYILATSEEMDNGWKLYYYIDKSGFVERFPEFSLFYRLFSPLDSEMICIFPYFYPCEESAREIREIFI